ncbi:uncharacterized protein [Littorina saxatilis]|uniref:uncharacterized protein n=1 Tax=Littorina saxatilis TaxID=31220 RepID=UPI0038B56D71
MRHKPTKSQSHTDIHTIRSPTIFTLYTNDCRATNGKLSKFADDSALVGLIQNDDDTVYKQEVDKLVEWCDQNSLDLNVGKTKEMITDFRRGEKETEPLVIGGKEVEQVQEYKYLGCIISSDLSWSKHIAKVVSKCNSRLYFLRKLKQFKVCPEILAMFYRASIESVLTFNLMVWYYGATVEDKSHLARVIRQAEKVVGVQFPSLDELVHKRTATKARKVVEDESHPLHDQYHCAQNHWVIASPFPEAATTDPLPSSTHHPRYPLRLSTRNR